MSKSKQIKGFTKVPNSILNNVALSLEEKALFAILISNSSDWKIHITEIYSRSINGEPKQRKVFKALIQKGYAIQERKKDSVTKKFNWIYELFPNGDGISRRNPSVGNPSVNTPPSDSPLVNSHDIENPSIHRSDINNTDLNNTIEEKNKEIKKEKREQGTRSINNVNNINTNKESHPQESTHGFNSGIEEKELDF